MQKFKSAIWGLALLSTASFAGECVKPDAPTLPDGASAAMKDMLEGQKSIKAFQTTNLEYMACLEKVFNDAEARSTEGTDEAKQAAKVEYTQAVDAYNAAVSKEEEVAGEFNTQIRAYKDANPG